MFVMSGRVQPQSGCHNNQMFLNIAKCPRGGKSSVVRTTELGLGNTSLEKISPIPLPVCLLPTVLYFNCLYTHHLPTGAPPSPQENSSHSTDAQQMLVDGWLEDSVNQCMDGSWLDAWKHG